MTRSTDAHRAAASRGITVDAAIEGTGLDMFRGAVELLGEAEALRAYARALNHTGKRSFTAVKRTLAKDIGLSQKRLTELGRLKLLQTRPGSRSLKASIHSTGRYLPLGEFKPSQLKAGTKASPFGNRRLFRGSFIFAGNRKSGQRMPNSHVFRNSGQFNPASGRDNLPVPMWGPAVPKQMVEEATAGEFTQTVNRHLPDRLAHEVERLTGGVIKRR